MTKKKNDKELEKAIETFLLAADHNWDDGYADLNKILKRKTCDLGTVALIYWRGQPEYYRKFKNEKESGDLSGWRFVHKVEKLFLSGDYTNFIRFDPEMDGTVFEKSKDFARDLPPEVYKTTPGEVDAADILAGIVGPGAMNAAAASNDVTLLKRVLSNGGELEYEFNQFTPLSTAVRKNSIDAIKFLLEQGADIKFKDTYGRSAIHLCLTIEATALMLDNGAELDTDVHGETLTHGIASGRSLYEDDLLAFVIEKGAKPNLQTEHGLTALHFAAETGQLKNLSELVEAGWDLDIHDSMGRSALHYSVARTHSSSTFDRGPVVEKLIGLGMDPENKDNSGVSAKDLAKKNAQANRLGKREREQILRVLNISI